jgi:asparagine synthase (glutamine-hydrolysing)
MCGIAGYIRFAQAGEKVTSARLVAQMTRSLRHRGPDDEGLTLIDSHSGHAMDLATDATASAVPPMASASPAPALPHNIALGQCRFSIVDLSPAGHQPFWSADRGICVIFNGEIYNHIELRRELERLGHHFRSECDTEVLVEAYRQWGTACFSRFIGFWAIALYDKRRRAVLLGRDRLGKAPLYTASRGGTLWFASEVPPILAAVDSGTFGIRKQAVADFLAHGWRDVGHQTFYDGIDTFPSACYAWVGHDGTFQPESYWRLPGRRLTERQLPVGEATAEFRRLLDEAVLIRLRADVPIGCELSGGLDSSCIVASAASAGRHIRAYTVSFPNSPFDEEPYARQVALRYREQIDYTVLHPVTEDFWAKADEYVARIAEPFHAPNILTNRSIWHAMARDGIRVSLNGAAGDESWGGYFNDYYEPYLRHVAAQGDLTQLVRNCALFGDTPHAPWSPTFLRRLRGALGNCRGPSSGYFTSSFGSRPHRLPDELNPIRLNRRHSAGPARDLEHMLVDHMGTWRMNYWLRVGNTNYMSVPMEVRCPFLDHRLVEFAFTVPVTYLIRDGWLKWLPRTAMSCRLPLDVARRKRKMGFPFPFQRWAVDSRGRFFQLIAGLDCPFIDGRRLWSVYDALANTNPLFLWRIMSLCLWWKKCVLGESLSEGPQLARGLPAA